jgi:hypothetical protein
MVQLVEARRALARKPGLGYAQIRTGWESGGVYTGTPNTAEARRIIVTSDMVLMTVSGSSDTEPRSDFHDVEWAFTPSTGVQRQIANQGFQGDVQAESVTDLTGNEDSVAVLRTVRNYPAALAPNTLIELHTVPVLDADMQTGLHTFLNRAGRAMWFPKRLSFTGDGTRRVSLAAYPWLFDESQFSGVSDREVTVGTDPLPLTGGGEIRFDGQTPYLLLDQVVTSGQAFYADFWRPRSTWVRRTALATATIAGGAVTAITVTDGAGGYTVAPTVTISGGGGSGATATAAINASGVVTGVTVTAGGTGYTTVPTVTLSVGGWTDSTVGLVAETDEIFADLDRLVDVAYYFLADDRANSTNVRGEVSSWAKIRDRAAQRAAPYMMWQRPAIAQANRRDSTRAVIGRRYGGVGLRSWP